MPDSFLTETIHGGRSIVDCCVFTIENPPKTVPLLGEVNDFTNLFSRNRSSHLQTPCSGVLAGNLVGPRGSVETIYMDN